MGERAAPGTPRDLAAQLSALLTDIDIAIRVRLRESARRTGGQPPRAARRHPGIRGAVLAALRRLTRPAGSRPAARREPEGGSNWRNGGGGGN